MELLSEHMSESIDQGVGIVRQFAFDYKMSLLKQEETLQQDRKNLDALVTKLREEAKSLTTKEVVNNILRDAHPKTLRVGKIFDILLFLGKSMKREYLSNYLSAMAKEKNSSIIRIRLGEYGAKL